MSKARIFVDFWNVQLSVIDVQGNQCKGYKVINAHFPPIGMGLAKACWASLDLRKAMPQISR